MQDITNMQLQITPAIIEINGNTAAEITRQAKKLIADKREELGTISRLTYKESKEFKNLLGRSSVYIEDMRKNLKTEIMTPYDNIKGDFDAISKVFLDEKHRYNTALTAIDDADKLIISELVDGAIEAAQGDIEREFILPLTPELERSRTLLGSVTAKGDLTSTVTALISGYIKGNIAYRDECIRRLKELARNGLKEVDLSNYKELDEEAFIISVGEKVARNLEIVASVREDNEQKIIDQNEADISLEIAKINAIVSFHLKDSSNQTGAIKLKRIAVETNNKRIQASANAGIEALLATIPGLTRWSATFTIEFDFRDVGTHEQIDEYLRARYRESIASIDQETTAIGAKRGGFFVSPASFNVAKKHI